jgi:hypothetical protein
MEQSPQLSLAQENMRAGAITKEGFLGNDTRSIIEIIQSDEAQLQRLGLTHEKIAEKMLVLTEAALEAMGGIVVVGNYRVSALEVQGSLPCPFAHPPLYSKAIVDVERLDTQKKLRWTPLSLHLIAKHNFYQGRGSYFRHEPKDLAEFLGII